MMASQEIRQRLDKQWETKTVQTDWLGMENLLRYILKSSLLATDKIAAIDETIAAYTRRGFTDPPFPMPLPRKNGKTF